jgi:hypothetical protein
MTNNKPMLRHAYRCLLLLGFFVPAYGQMQSQLLQLAPPQTPAARLLAKPGQTIPFDFRWAGAEIRYTTDGSEPTAASPLYAKPLRSRGLKTVKAKAFRPGFAPSAATTVQLVPPGSIAIDSIAMAAAPKKYLANGWRTLCDGMLGDANFNENWLGFAEKTVEATVLFEKAAKVSQLAIGYLQQQNAWIFAPAQVQVYDEKGRLLCSQAVPDAGQEQAPSQAWLTVALPKGKYRSLTIRLLGLPAIPDWHPGKGGTGWLFLDEILAYRQR